MAAIALRMARGHLLGAGSGEALLSRSSPALLRRMSSDRVLSDEEKAAENVYFKVRAWCHARLQVAVKKNKAIGIPSCGALGKAAGNVHLRLRVCCQEASLQFARNAMAWHILMQQRTSEKSYTRFSEVNVRHHGVAPVSCLQSWREGGKGITGYPPCTRLQARRLDWIPMTGPCMAAS